MTSDKILARLSNAWYIWTTASAIVILADMVFHGVTKLNTFAALLSIAFAVLTFSGKRAVDFVVACYQERRTLVGRTTAMPLATGSRSSAC